MTSWSVFVIFKGNVYMSIVSIHITIMRAQDRVDIYRPNTNGRSTDDEQLLIYDSLIITLR